jgi:hypothetical protein
LKGNPSVAKVDALLTRYEKLIPGAEERLKRKNFFSNDDKINNQIKSVTPLLVAGGAAVAIAAAKPTRYSVTGTVTGYAPGTKVTLHNGPRTAVLGEDYTYIGKDGSFKLNASPNGKRSLTIDPTRGQSIKIWEGFLTKNVVANYP